jgi:RND family efflux transporter MFP subunit
MTTRFAYLAAALLAIAGCKDAATVSQEQPVPKVTVAPVVVERIVDSDEYIGRTEASEIVEVRSRIFGFLTDIGFQDGDMVEKDKTVLFKIEPDEYQAIYDQSVSRIALNDAKLELEKTKRDRNQKLAVTGAVSQEELDESIAAVKEVEAAIVAAKADAARTAIDLKYTTILAPISGRIDRAYVSKGNLVTGGLASGTLLTKIVQEKPMYVYFDVDERSLLRYKRMRPAEDKDRAPGSLRDLGMKCFVQLADEKDFPHEGVLDFASAEVNYNTGTARVRGVFPNTDRMLSSGLFVRVRVPVSDPYDALLIPERALATDQSIKFVYVVDSDGTAKRRNVELGNARGDMRIINSGLQAGDKVIVKGLQRVKPDQKVEAEEETAKPAPSAPAADSRAADSPAAEKVQADTVAPSTEEQK